MATWKVHPWYKIEVVVDHPCVNRHFRYLYARKVDNHPWQPERSVEIFTGRGCPIRITPEEARHHFQVIKQVSGYRQRYLTNSIHHFVES